MKKGESPDFTAKWWKGSQPKGLKTAGGLETALGNYESAKKALDSSREEKDAKAAETALGKVDAAVNAVIAEARKASKTKEDEMALTVICLEKLEKMENAERRWIEEHTGEEDDGMFSDPEVYHQYLITVLKRLRSSGEMNFGFVLGKKAEDHRLALHKSKSAKSLASNLTKETGLRQFTFGVARPDEDRAGMLVLTLEGRQLPGMGKKGARMLKKFKPLPFTKLALVVDGKEVEDLLDPDDTDVDVADDEDQPSGYDATALTHALAELVRRIQGVTDAALKGDLGRMATQANALLRSNNLPEASQRLDELRTALDRAGVPAAAGATGGNPAGAGGASTVAYAKSRLAWIAARKKVENEIDKLRSEIVTTYKDDGIADQLESSYRARVAPVLAALDESLADKLDEATNATDAAVRAGLVAEAKAIMQRYQSYLGSESLIKDLDDNPFVPLTIQQTISATLSALEKAVH